MNGPGLAILALILGSSIKQKDYSKPSNIFDKLEPVTRMDQGDELKTPPGNVPGTIPIPQIRTFGEPALTAIDIPAAPPVGTGSFVTTQRPARSAATGWRFFTPAGPIESRPMTPDEKDSGLGCPEVPGAWDMTKNSLEQWKYCANPQCPSNNRELDLATGNYLEPTPAVLQQETDQAGIISYYCPVCRNRS